MLKSMIWSGFSILTLATSATAHPLTLEGDNMPTLADVPAPFSETCDWEADLRPTVYDLLIQNANEILQELATGTTVDSLALGTPLLSGEVQYTLMAEPDLGTRRLGDLLDPEYYEVIYPVFADGALIGSVEAQAVVSVEGIISLSGWTNVRGTNRHVHQLFSEFSANAENLPSSICSYRHVVIPWRDGIPEGDDFVAGGLVGFNYYDSDGSEKLVPTQVFRTPDVEWWPRQAYSREDVLERLHAYWVRDRTP